MNVYLSRQPIFDWEQKVFAYELLFCFGRGGYYFDYSGSRATTEVITNSFLVMDSPAITRGKKAFINFPKALLDDEIPLLLPPAILAVEIPGSVEADQYTVEICTRLKKRGYILVLSDFSPDSATRPLLPLADIVKIDFLNTGQKERDRVISLVAAYEVQLLADRVESAPDFAEAMKRGFSFFQGYFFCKPIILKSKDIPGVKMHHLRLLQEIYKPELDFDRLEQLIKQDLSLSYKLLRFINTVAFSVRNEIRSIRQAMVLLGRTELIKWATLVALRNIGYDKPDELMITAVSRAGFCENVAVAAGYKERSADYFILGLFSLVDAILDRPMEEILNGLPLAAEIKDALVGAGNSFKQVLDLVLLYERGNWDEAFASATASLGLEEKTVINCYLDSLQLANSSLTR